MKIILSLNEAQNLSSEDFDVIIKQLKDYTAKTQEGGWLDITNGDEICKMVIHTHIDIDVSEEGSIIEYLHIYYNKTFIEKFKLNIHY